jgi:hypothetical protein
MNLSFDFQYEGYAYLGFGALLIVFWVLVHWIRQGRLYFGLLKVEKHLPVLVAGVFMSLFAITHRFSWNHKWIEIPFLESFFQIGRLGDTFRASGRMFWLPYYLILFFFLRVFCISFGEKRRRLAWALLFLALIQAYDLKEFCRNLKESTVHGYPGRPKWANRLKSDFWTKVSETHKTMLFFPEGKWLEWCYDIGDFGIRNGVSTNAVDAARGDQNESQKLQVWMQTHLENIDIPSDFIFVTTEKEFFKQIHNKYESLGKKADPKIWFGEVDGLQVIYKKI